MNGDETNILFKTNDNEKLSYDDKLNIDNFLESQSSVMSADHQISKLIIT